MAEATAVKEAIADKATQVAGIDKAEPKFSPAAEQVRTLAKKAAGREVLKAARENRPMGLSDERINSVATLLTLRTVDEQNDVTARLSSVDALLTQGYDTHPDKNELRTEILTAFDNSSSMNGVIQPAERGATAEAMLKDDEIRDILNGKIQDIATRQGPTPDEIQARIAYRISVGDDRGDPAHPKHQELVDLARGECEAVFQAKLIRDTENLVGDSVNELFRRNFDAADDVINIRGDELDALVAANETKAGRDAAAGAIKKIRDEYSVYTPDAYKKGGVVEQRFKDFVERGLEGAGLTPDEIQAIKDAGLTEEYEKTIGQMMLTNRMKVGKLDIADINRLSNAEWMGATQDERMDKLEQIVTSNERVKNLIERGQEDGWLTPKLWDRIKNAGPAGAAGMVTALMAVLLGPGLIVGAPILAAAGIGGAAVGGAIRDKIAA